MINPLLFFALDRFAPRLEVRERGGAADRVAVPGPSPELPVTRLRDHTVLVGYGQVGSRIGQALKARGVPFLVIDERDTTAEQLRAEGIEVIRGNAGQRGLLKAANLAEAQCLMSAIQNPFEASNLLEKARRANPNINIIARAHSEAEVAHLETFGANHVVLGEREIAREMVNFLLATLDGVDAHARAEEDAFEAPAGADRARA